LNNTFKTLGAAFLALEYAMHNVLLRGDASQAIFRDVIEQIMQQGGDAHINAAVAGALVGAYLRSVRPDVDPIPPPGAPL